ncbi:hypothetical protein MP228_004062 [Amoeboaphelidium protococcarum]|nr:hypothetical protein MP228_004062 [Amoeboaphelidium protococcarum]
MILRLCRTRLYSVNLERNKIYRFNVQISEDQARKIHADALSKHTVFKLEYSQPKITLKYIPYIYTRVQFTSNMNGILLWDQKVDIPPQMLLMKNTKEEMLVRYSFQRQFNFPMLIISDGSSVRRKLNDVDDMLAMIQIAQQAGGTVPLQAIDLYDDNEGDNKSESSDQLDCYYNFRESHFDTSILLRRALNDVTTQRYRRDVIQWLASIIGVKKIRHLQMSKKSDGTVSSNDIFIPYYECRSSLGTVYINAVTGKVAHGLQYMHSPSLVACVYFSALLLNQYFSFAREHATSFWDELSSQMQYQFLFEELDVKSLLIKAACSIALSRLPKMYDYAVHLNDIYRYKSSGEYLQSGKDLSQLPKSNRYYLQAMLKDHLDQEKVSVEHIIVKQDFSQSQLRILFGESSSSPKVQSQIHLRVVTKSEHTNDDSVKDDGWESDLEKILEEPAFLLKQLQRLWGKSSSTTNDSEKAQSDGDKVKEDKQAKAFKRPEPSSKQRRRPRLFTKDNFNVDESLLYRNAQMKRQQSATLQDAINIEKSRQELEYKLVHRDSRQLYECLDLSGKEFSSSQSDIQAQFKTLAHQYHPDKHFDAPEAVREMYSEKFMKLKKAYEILKDPVQKKRYDDECIQKVRVSQNL